MMPPDAWQPALAVSLSFVGSVLLGVLYFRAIRATADLIVSGQHPMLAIAATLGRFGLLGVGFALALQAGGLAVLAVLAGVLAGRGLVMRPMPRTSA